MTGARSPLYSDRHSIFTKQDPEEATPTQFERAARALGIELILASSPQAKGRVERAFQTLQDRLVKALRLAGIDTLEAANACLPDFIAHYNARFAKPPRSQEDAHRRLDIGAEQLYLATCEQHVRTLSKSLSCQYRGRQYLIQTGGSTNNADYLSFNALGRALINALPLEQVRAWLPPGFVHAGPTRSVVLIDEIDKAPRDFPNDLLNEIEQMYFRVPELGNVAIGGPGVLAESLRPIVFLTSNSEKNLPDPFLRRCVDYHIPFPDRDRLQEILLARLTRLGATAGPLLEDALAFFVNLREAHAMRRRISPAELIQWLTWMLAAGARPEQRLREAGQLAMAGLGAIIKDPANQPQVRALLEAFLAA